MRKHYDRDYFDRWYRSEGIEPDAGVRRRVSLVVSIAEQLLGRRVRSMLDVGCGEGRWGLELKRLRPGAGYAGVDSSRYVVERFGKSRNIRSGTFGGLGRLGIEESFDIVVCSDVLHYLGAREIDRGLAAAAGMLDGIAYLAVHPREDDPVGDLAGWKPRSAAWYRDRFRRAGLVSCGMQCWIGPTLADSATALDLCAGPC